MTPSAPSISRAKASRSAFGCSTQPVRPALCYSHSAAASTRQWQSRTSSLIRYLPTTCRQCPSLGQFAYPEVLFTHLFPSSSACPFRLFFLSSLDFYPIYTQGFASVTDFCPGLPLRCRFQKTPILHHHSLILTTPRRWPCDRGIIFALFKTIRHIHDTGRIACHNG